MPPHGLLLLAIVSIQLGAVLATHLFPILGALFLSERIGVQGIAAVACVVVAAVGISVSDAKNTGDTSQG